MVDRPSKDEIYACVCENLIKSERRPNKQNGICIKIYAQHDRRCFIAWHEADTSLIWERTKNMFFSMRKFAFSADSNWKSFFRSLCFAPGAFCNVKRYKANFYERVGNIFINFNVEFEDDFPLTFHFSSQIQNKARKKSWKANMTQYF